ncbi:MAG TPA: hypothetical protein PLM71_03300 [Syntrophorhabdaceae bacterium]|nr:hypothetical protein [Syntrophorhabdaceae bacterium]
MGLKHLLIAFIFLLTPNILLASVEGTTNVTFPIWTPVFFIALILAIAIMPLINSEW